MFVVVGTSLNSAKCLSLRAFQAAALLSLICLMSSQEGDEFVFQLKHQGLPPTVFKADQETSAKR